MQTFKIHSVICSPLPSYYSYQVNITLNLTEKEQLKKSSSINLMVDGHSWRLHEKNKKVTVIIVFHK